MSYAAISVCAAASGVSFPERKLSTGCKYSLLPFLFLSLSLILSVSQIRYARFLKFNDRRSTTIESLISLRHPFQGRDREEDITPSLSLSLSSVEIFTIDFENKSSRKVA
ncbi:unnamed protein product [Lasius platythorax]|uniref:Uncharacterized protein n=1 Tax=Lasius platythorax TaxID=488582 RepID=A0AAV2NM80_9HYME